MRKFHKIGVNHDGKIFIAKFEGGHEVIYPAIVDGKIEIPNDVKIEAVENLVLQSVKEFDFSKVEILGASCFSRSELEKVDLPSHIQTREGNFANCFNLTEAKIASKKVASSMFDGCRFLESVELAEGVENIESWAFRRTSIASLKLPKSLKRFDLSSIDEAASLRELEFPSLKSELEVVCACNPRLLVDGFDLSQQSWKALIRRFPEAYLALPNKYFLGSYADNQFLMECREEAYYFFMDLGDSPESRARVSKFSEARIAREGAKETFSDIVQGAVGIKSKN